MYGRSVLPNNSVFPTRVSADGLPKYKAGGANIDWANTVTAPGTDTTLADGSIVKSGKKYLRYGQIVTKIILAATKTVTITGTPSGGTFTVTVTTPNGTVTTAQTTTALAYNASAADVQAAVVALSNVGAGNVTVTGTAGGASTAEINTMTPGTPTAGDTLSVFSTLANSGIEIVTNSTATATSTTTQLKAAWNGNPLLTAIGTASGTTTFIVTGVTAGQALGITSSATGTGTLTNVVTGRSLPYTITFPDALGPVTLASSGASLTGGSTPAATATSTAPGGNDGWFGPYDPAATDGRQTLTRGSAFILDETLLEYSTGTTTLSSANDQTGGLIEGGSVFIDRVLNSGTSSHTLAAGPTLAEVLGTFPLLQIVQN